MQDAGRRWLGRAVWALLFVPLTLFLAYAGTRQEVDSQNHALKDPRSVDQQNLEHLADVVPGDAVVLLGFAVPGDIAILPADRTALEECRPRLAAVPGVVGTTMLPSPEPSLALMTVSLRGAATDSAARDVVALARAAAPPSLRVLATGLPLVEARVSEIVAKERAHIVPWLVGALLLVASLVYRSVALGAATLMPALAAIAWTGGIVALLGHRLDPVASLLDPVLLTIGVASSVHHVEAYRRARRDGLDPVAAVRRASESQLQPGFIAMATTMVGLLSLCTSSIPAVVDFGVRSTFGVALVHVFTFALLPAWLPFAARGPVRAENAYDLAGPWLGAIARWRTALLALTIAITAIAAAALPRLRADNDPLSLLPANDALRLEHTELVSHLGGVEVFHLLAPERTPGTEPSRLLPFVAAVHTLPGAAGLAGPARRNTEGDLAVPILLGPQGSAVRVPLFDEIDRAARAIGLDGLVAAGAPVQIARDSAALMQSLIGSFQITLVLLFLGTAWGLRSWWLGALGMLPNLMPCVWIYGAIAWIDRPVSVATAMIAATMLGLIVDNSLHFLHEFRLHRDRMPRYDAALEALRHCGRGMCLSSGLLIAGFAVTATSRVATTVEFSLLAGATILVGIFSDVVLMPLLLLRDAAGRGANAHAA